MSRLLGSNLLQNQTYVVGKIPTKKGNLQGETMKALLAKAIIIVAIGLTLFGLFTLNYGALRIGF